MEEFRKDGRKQLLRTFSESNGDVGRSVRGVGVAWPVADAGEAA